jgi:putative aminopeptidase FrvX
MDKSALGFFEELCNAAGPSGFEKEPITLVKNYVAPFVDRHYSDKMGNFMFERTGMERGPRVLLAGHIDEVGFIITGINNLGYLAFRQLGGWFDQVLLGQRVKVMSRKGLLAGIISCKPPHLMDAEEMKKVVTKDKMFIDIGAANLKEAQEMGVRLGDAVVPDSRFSTLTKTSFKDGKRKGKRTLAFGKAFDNRYGAFVAAEVMRVLHEDKVSHPNIVIGATTVQEEVGLRGAKTVAASVQPDVAIVLDVDIAGDVPGIDPLQAPAKMGEGVAITVFDSSMIPNQPLKELVIDICEKKRIPYQLAYTFGGGTDGGMIHTSNMGVPSLALGAPTRHIHSHVGVLDLKDLGDSVRLTVEIVKALDRRTVEGFTSI